MREPARERRPVLHTRHPRTDIRAGQAMRGQVGEPSGHDPGWAARHVWENSPAEPTTMRAQVPEQRDHGWGEARWIVFNPGPSDPGVGARPPTPST
jgi:hypothetical protein